MPISHLYHCSTVLVSTVRLDKNMYYAVTQFVQDLRSIFGNCLRFNSLANDSFRPVAKTMAETSEDLMHLFIQQMSTQQLYTKLLYCWKTCLQILDQALALKNPDDGYPTAHYFLHPVMFYFGGSLPPEYSEKVKTPIDFGTITSKLFEGTYQTVAAFVADCRLVTTNCKAFYAGKNDGVMFVGQATRLEQFLSQPIDALVRYDASQQGIEARRAAQNPPLMVLSKIPKNSMVSMLQMLRNTPYTDRLTKVSVD